MYIFTYVRTYNSSYHIKSVYSLELILFIPQHNAHENNYHTQIESMQDHDKEECLCVYVDLRTHTCNRTNFRLCT